MKKKMMLIGALVFSLLFCGGCEEEIGIGNFSVKISPELELNGEGSNVDSMAFWEAPENSDVLLFVTGKGNHVVEVWKYPFKDNEQEAINFDNTPNGVVVSQNRDELYVGGYNPSRVDVFSLPDLEKERSFGQELADGETNLDILSNGKETIYVSDSHSVHAFDIETGEEINTISPPVTSVETVLADDYHQIIYIPEEQGGKGKSPGLHAYNPDGSKHFKEGQNVFGKDVFQADEEGILLYRCLENGEDTGEGFIVVSDQRDAMTEFEFFDRKSWRYLGNLMLDGVSNTDGIASTQKSFDGYPEGIFAAVDDDSSVTIVGWDTIFDKTGISCSE